MASNNLIENGNVWNAKGHVIPGRTGLVTGIAASGILAAVRNIGPSELVVTAVEQYWSTTVAGTTFGGLGFGFVKVSGFTALASGGARAAEPVPVRKRNADHRRLFPSSAAALADNAPNPDTLVQVEVSDTAVLSGGVFTAPAFDDPIAAFIAAMGVISATSAAYWGQSIWQPRSGIPLTLGSDEGLVFYSLDAFPTTLSGRYGIGVEAHVA